MNQLRLIWLLFFCFMLVSVLSCTPSIPGGQSAAVIGYLGCSNTRQTVQAYQLVGGEQMWFADEGEIHEYDGGAVLNWARSSERGYKQLWNVFDHYLQQNPNTSVIWWQVCIRKEEAEITYEEALPVLEGIRARVPRATIYVSSLPDFPEHQCEITGREGISRAKSLIAELDEKNDDVVLGPVVGPLFLADIDDQDESRCHPQVDGARKTGRQLKIFFDNLWENDGSEVTAAEISANLSEKVVINETRTSLVPLLEIKPSLTPEEKVWRNRIEASLKTTPCPERAKPEYPSSYYQGQLIDTHLHIPAIPDWGPEEEDPEGIPEGRFGGPQALLGWNVKMSTIACTITHEGTRRNFAFFPVYEGKISLRLLEIWNRTMQQYPHQFTPFIMSSGNDDDPEGFPTVDAKTLEEMLSVYPNLFKGYGEIGLYAREDGGSSELPPDAQRLQEIYPLIRKHRLIIYFHLGDGQKDNFERVLQQYPEIIFIWHGDQLSVEEVKDVLRNHPNAYYGIDEFFGGEQDIFELYVGKSKEEYLKSANNNFDKIVNQAVNHWRSLLEQYPDQVIWGTDRGDAVWNYDPEVGLMQVKIARAFIGKLDPNVQEKFAYQNAERILNVAEEAYDESK